MGFDITSDITFRKLSIFMTFMEKGNIARTAETLGLSGVSVHRALHTLEENVRCPLFTHKGRNLIALPSAPTLLEYCQEVMQVMERGLEESRKVAGIGQGRLRVGIALLADAGNRAAPDHGHEAASPGSGDGSDDGL